MSDSFRRPRLADLHVAAIAAAAVLLLAAAWGLRAGIADGERGHLLWRAAANQVAIALPWAGALAALTTAQFVALLTLLGRRRRAGIALAVGWGASAAALAALPGAVHLLAQRIPPEKLPVFANDPASMEAFLRRILGALLAPDRLWTTLADKASLWLPPLIVPTLLGLLAYGLLHFPLRQWSSREGGRIRRAAWLAPLLVGAAAGCGPALLGALTRPRAESRSDLVLISVDTLRRDAVRAYGGGEGATPSLDRLAGEGTRLLGMRAPSSWTLPSHAAMLTGRWPWSLGVFRVADALSGAAATLAERLAAQGYDTHAVVTHLFVDAPYGFGQGFDRIEHPPSELARDAVKAAGGWLARRSRAPAFLFLHLYDPHWPYQPPDDAPEALLAGTSAADRREAQRYTDAFEFALALQNGPPSLIAAARALYHAEVWSADRELGKLFAQVRQSGRPTVIAVVSDHGEMFGEHGMIGHGITLFEDEVRVPCLIAGAGVPGGVTLDGPASLVDLAPTLLELTGVKAAAAEFDGRSLAAALRAGAPLEARWVAGENRSLSPTPTRYLSDGNWKWFSGIDQPVRTARVVYPAAVHHVDRDPAEATDLTGAPDLPAFAELAATLFAEEGRAAREVSLDPAERARLRSLGYLP